MILGLAALAAMLIYTGFLFAEQHVMSRKLDAQVAELDRLLEVDTDWREAQARLDGLRGQRNTISATIPVTAKSRRRSRLADRPRPAAGR